jgi:hypothetical protein
MLRFVCGWTQMEVGTLSRLGGRWSKWQNNYVSLGIKETKSLVICFIFCIWLCFVILQVILFNIVLQLSALGELVWVMEWNPCCSVNDLYGECESWFLEMIGTIVSKEWEDEVWDGLYESKWGGWKACILGGRS